VIPNITRGANTLGVLRYLLGKGRREEHKDPHLVVGSPEAVLSAAGRQLEAADAGGLARHLDEPREVYGTRVTIAERDQNGRTVGVRDAHVWHCSLSLHPDEPELEEGRWGELADRFVERMGFAGAGARAQCRWVAVRHGRSAGGSDHVHLVVGLVAEDGSKASVHNDRPRAQQACRELELGFGLRGLEARVRETGSRGLKHGELAADRRRGRQLGERGEHPERCSRQTLERIVRACAVASRDESEFVRRLGGQGVWVRPRYAQGGTQEVVGYSVRLPGPERGSQGVWFGGGRLARDLTLPRLRAGWASSPSARQEALGAWAGRDSLAGGEPSGELEAAMWPRYVQQVAQITDRLRQVPAGDRAQWAHAAAQGAAVLAAWSQRVEPEPGPLARAAGVMARSAQLPAWRAAPKPSAPAAARGVVLKLASAADPSNRALGWAVLVRQVANLAKALHDVHLAAGDVDRAREIEAMARTELADVAGRLQDAYDRPALDEQALAAAHRAAQGQLQAGEPKPPAGSQLEPPGRREAPEVPSVRRQQLER